MTLRVAHLSRALGTLLLVLCATPAAAQSGGDAPPRKSVADGVYTEAQSQRGEATFRSVCTACHTVGDFSGEPFLKRWPTVGSLFDIISTTMPQDLPGGLSSQQYAEVVAFILNRNNFPAGASELPTEVEPLNAITILPPRR